MECIFCSFFILYLVKYWLRETYYASQLVSLRIVNYLKKYLDG